MKILAVSDFDNGFPKNLGRILKKEKPDVILAGGDFCYGTKIRKMMFANYHGKSNWYDAIGKKKAAKLLLESTAFGNKVLKILNGAGIPVFLVYGNNDRIGYKKEKWALLRKDFFTPLVKKYKNIQPIDLGIAKYCGCYFVGYGQGCSSPEIPMYKVQARGKTKKEISKAKKDFKKTLKSVDRLFKKVDIYNTIFLVHNVPFGTKLDKITSKSAPKIVQGKHYGSVVVRKIIEKYHPPLCIGGHMHEGFGVAKIGKTTCINDGEGTKGRYAIIEIKKGKLDVKLR
ncbi:MAG: metallophosphoesterase [archaeon]